MSAQSHRPEKAGRLAALREALDDGAIRSAQRLISTLHPAEVAQLLESLPPARREIVWELTDPELDGDVLVELSEDVRDELIRDMDPEELAAAAEGMEVDDLADLIDSLPETVTQQLLRNMDQQDRERLTRMLSWPEHTAGSLMNTDTVSVRADVSLEVVQRYLRMRGELPERTDRLFVVDRQDRFLGTVTLARLLTDDPDRLVGLSLDTEAPRIAPDLPASEVAQLFKARDLVSTAVVDDAGLLLGRVTIDDVVDVITEEAAHEVMAGAGLRDAFKRLGPPVPMLPPALSGGALPLAEGRRRPALTVWLDVERGVVARRTHGWTVVENKEAMTCGPSSFPPPASIAFSRAPWGGHNFALAWHSF